jgi:transposase
MSQSDEKPGSRRGSPNYDPEFRQRLTLESCKPGVSVSKLAREHGINANMLFNWRRRYRERRKAAAATTLVPVSIIGRRAS